MNAGIDFRELTLDDADRVLRWRTSERVQRQMASRVNAAEVDQRVWVDESFRRPDYYHWLILFSGEPVGLINLQNYRPREASASWGFYIGEDAALGLGGLVPPYFYNWLFESLRVRTVIAEVLPTNSQALKLHAMHGYETRGRTDAGLVVLVLEKAAWDQQRFRRFSAAFPTEHWLARPPWLAGQ